MRESIANLLVMLFCRACRIVQIIAEKSTKLGGLKIKSDFNGSMRKDARASPYLKARKKPSIQVIILRFGRDSSGA